jgi:hypothetical protein
MASRSVLRGGVVGALIVGALWTGISSAAAGRPDPPGKDANSCVNSFGVDYNALYGISDQFRTFECRQITAGEHWIAFTVWITDDGADSVYPEGYVPSEPAPVDDFVSKVDAVKVVVDGGTSREKTQSFTASQAIRTDVNAEELEPGAWPVPSPMASILPRVRPLSAGIHTFEIIVVLSAVHCDGLGADPDLQCLPAGEIPFIPPRQLTVITP